MRVVQALKNADSGLGLIGLKVSAFTVLEVTALLGLQYIWGFLLKHPIQYVL